MSAGDFITGPRCCEPVRHCDRAGRSDFSAVCWRPRGHLSRKHLSRYAYLNELRRPSRKRNARSRQGLAA